MSTIACVLARGGNGNTVAALSVLLAGLAPRGAQAGQDGACGPVTMAWRGRAHEATGLHRGPGLLLVADARLDHRADLARALALAPGEAARWRDVDLIAAAWRRWGEEMPEHLEGDFALALWDVASDTLFAARDRFGVRPLAWAERPGAWEFASEPAALAAGHGTASDAVWVRDYLAGGEGDAERTPFVGVRRLPAAHALVFRAGAASLRRYWTPQPRTERSARRDADHVAAFRERFDAAVGSRLRMAPRVAAMLSGGLDSSSIACAAAAQGANVQAYSLRFPTHPASDEGEWIARVREHAGLDGIEIETNDRRPLAAAMALRRSCGEPVLAPNLDLHAALYERAAAHGHTAMLDGFDGDLVVSHGFGRLSDLWRSGSWAVLASEIAWLRSRPGSPRLRRLLQHALRGEGESRHHARALARPLIQTALELVDRIAARAGVQPLYPFFDRALAELCLGLPPRLKLSGGWTRVVLRRACEGLLPESVRWRPDKSDLQPSFEAGLARERTQLLALAGTGAVLPDSARAAMARLAAGGAAIGRDGLLAWRAALVADWRAARIAPMREMEVSLPEPLEESLA